MVQSSLILLFGQDTRLVQTRQWVLERAGFRTRPALNLIDLDRIAMAETIDLFLLCDSLLPEVRSSAIALIQLRWPSAKRLVLAPSIFTAELEPLEQIFPALDGPRKLVLSIHQLLANELPSTQ